MTRVQAIFADFFAYVLLMEQKALHGTPLPSYEQVRGDLTTLLDQHKIAAEREGISTEDYLNARFAIVAWADETILKYPSWDYHGQWGANPLQLEYYQTNNAGEEFFDRLDRLRPDQKEIREVYYYCLGLGFSGRYSLGSDAERTLTHIRHDQAKYVSQPVENLPDIHQLTPQPYTANIVSGKPITTPSTSRLLKAGIVLLVAVPVLLWLAYMWILPMLSTTRPVATHKETTEESKEVKETSPPELSLAERLDQWLSTHQDLLQCARITVNLTVSQNGVFKLQGRVASQSQQDTLLNRIPQEVQGITRIENESEIIPRPFCEVLDLLEPFYQGSNLQPSGLAMQLGKTGDRPIYNQGDNLVIDVQVPSAFESYVYVDYFSSDEFVAHLFPNSRQFLNLVQPNRRFRIGADAGPNALRIAPPPGLELITVVASKRPLFTPQRFEPEKAQLYINALRQSLDGVDKVDVIATYHFIVNRERS